MPRRQATAQRPLSGTGGTTAARGPQPSQQGVKDKFYFTMVGVMAALAGVVLYLRAMQYYPPTSQQTASAYQAFLVFWLVIVARFTYTFVWQNHLTSQGTAQWQPGGIELPGTTRKLDADGEPALRSAAQFKSR
ncbi:hypothetical protein WJX74_006836 [Apatococcus lobatus]|uniref:Uncharacterized protein n=2 Tax=Apatococcus TaxID=904362 RepID=A0AAW1T515_9CHLO